MADVSDDETTTTITFEEAQDAFKDKQQARRFKSVAFYGACAIVCAFLVALLYWLVWWPSTSFDLHQFAGGIADPNKYASFISQTKTIWGIGIITLAAIPTTLALALLRFAFGASAKNEKDDIPSVWLSLAKEVVDVIKQYIGKKT